MELTEKQKYIYNLKDDIKLMLFDDLVFNKLFFGKEITFNECYIKAKECENAYISIN